MVRRDHTTARDVCDESTVQMPFVGSLAAGSAFHGFFGEYGLSDDAVDLIDVPAKYEGKNRFVVEVAGDSMEPRLRKGQRVVFEYHRNPRGENQIVIANIPEFGLSGGGFGVEAIKRISQTAEEWVFSSDNPAYEPIRVSKTECSYPILGVFLGALEEG